VRFEEYVADQGPSLLRLAYVLTGDSHLAEDLTQTALADAYRHWRKVIAAERPDAYVRRMLVNAHINSRRRRSSTERPTDLSAQGGGVEADPGIDVAARDEIRRLLDMLAPRARTVLVLRYYADLDDAAIAAAMGLTTSSVRASASRALAALRTASATNGVEELR
jgi:RNA polymerase sigma-70 factor (sigma-E family)